MRNYIIYQTDRPSAKRPYKVACKKCGYFQFRTKPYKYTCLKCKDSNETPHLWRAITNKLFMARGKKCEICARESNLHIHHKNKNRYDNDESNLQILCTHCHQSVHRNWGKKLVDIYVGKFGTRLTWAKVALT